MILNEMKNIAVGIYPAPLFTSGQYDGLGTRKEIINTGTQESSRKVVLDVRVSNSLTFVRNI